MRRIARAAAAAVLLLRLFILAPAATAGQSAVAGGVLLDVPYLPQTELLCGGAAAAMLLRYWGDTHASVQQFAPLVDRAAGGIADSVLLDAIRARRWSVTRLTGSVATLRAELHAKRPPMLLIEDRPQRYHYVVAVGVDADGLLVHDPTWGPARRLSWERLDARWTPTGFWLARIEPGVTTPPPSTVPPPTTSSVSSPSADATCDALFEAALDRAEADGLDLAESSLVDVARACPLDGRPLAELAGIRFAARDWDDASRLASEALRRDAGHGYAADVLGSTRFMMGDTMGALHAWNRIGRPLLDSVHITGLLRMRYSLLVQAMNLPSDTRLEAASFALAQRRLGALPDVAASRLALRPGEDGYAVVEAAVVERATLPKTRAQWAAAAAHTALEREVRVHLPGRAGEGEAWSARWGWWERRPRASVLFAAPWLRGPRGVWQVALDWERQSYGRPETSDVRETRLTGDVGLRTWLTPQLHIEAAAGLDSWRRDSARPFRTVHATGALEHRFLADHLSARLAAGWWLGFEHPGFTTVSAELSARSRREPRPLVIVAQSGLSFASDAAPLALWGGAGEGRGRAPLLRAHGLLHDGRIDGAAFGRTLTHGTLEVQHWLPRPSVVRIGGAVFADAAAAGRRPPLAPASRGVLVDGGAGLRVRVPGSNGLFRIDYVRGLRDSARVWVFGWQAE